MQDYKIEWCLTLLDKYSTIIFEKQLNTLTKTQMLFMIHLKHRPGIHQDQLAVMFKTNRSTVTRAIDQLIDKGYVLKKVDVDNRKANVLLLTESGDKAYIEIMEAVDRYVDILTKGMSEEEKLLSVKLLSHMAGNVCEYLGDTHLSRLIRGE